MGLAVRPWSFQAVLSLFFLAVPACTGSIGDQPREGTDGAGGMSGGDRARPDNPDEGPRPMMPDPELPNAEVCDDYPQARVLRLSDRQYENALQSLLKNFNPVVQVRSPGASPHLFVERMDSSSIGTALTGQYSDAATEAGEAVAANPTMAGFECAEADATEGSCAREWISNFLSRAFRKPIAPEQLDAYANAFADNAQVEIGEGVRVVVEAALQSPFFLYRTEIGSGDRDEPWVALTDHQLAEQIAFWLTDTIPDPQLLQAAENGELQTTDGIRQHVQRLMNADTAKENISAAFDRWFGFSNRQALSKDSQLFPNFADARDDLFDSASRLLRHQLWQSDSPATDLFDTEQTFANDRIADYFGLTPTMGNDLQRASMGNRRAGILTHPAFMATLATDHNTHVIRRGVFVRREVLCQTLPSPPQEALEEAEEATHLTQREFAAVRAMRSECQGCHALIDPIGLMFEVYDSAGAYRNAVDGETIDTATQIVGTDFDGRFDGPVDLARAIAQSQETSACVAAHMVELGLSERPRADDCQVKNLVTKMQAAGGRLEELIVDIAVSDAFRFRSINPGG